MTIRSQVSSGQFKTRGIASRSGLLGWRPGVLALSKLDITGITITEVKGFGRPRGTKFFPGDESVVNFLPRIRLEVGVASDQVERTVAAIKTAVRTGQIGDGKIFVTPLEHAVDIQTDETDSQTI